MPSLPPTAALPHSPDSTLTTVLDLLFEPSPPLHTLALPLLRSTSFPDYNALISAVRAELLALATTPSQTTHLSNILCAHPRLGEKKVDSEQSRKEQAQLQAGDNQEEKNKLHALNKEYEDRFPGLRYVVFVNGRSRPLIMENMRARIDRGDIEEERREAIQAMCDIAIDRAGKLGVAEVSE